MGVVLPECGPSGKLQVVAEGGAMPGGATSSKLKHNDAICDITPLRQKTLNSVILLQRESTIEMSRWVTKVPRPIAKMKHWNVDKLENWNLKTLENWKMEKWG